MLGAATLAPALVGFAYYYRRMALSYNKIILPEHKYTKESIGDTIVVTVSRSHLLYLEPSIRRATRPVTPPVKCTGSDPTMSIIPETK